MENQKHKAAVCQEQDSTSIAQKYHVFTQTQVNVTEKKKHWGSKYAVRVQFYTLHVWFYKLEVYDMYNTKN